LTAVQEYKFEIQVHSVAISIGREKSEYFEVNGVTEKGKRLIDGNIWPTASSQNFQWIIASPRGNQFISRPWRLSRI
jgi:hypothetical protein